MSISNLACDECTKATMDVCPTCGETPLCKECAEGVGECAACAADGDGYDDDDDDDDGDDF